MKRVYTDYREWEDFQAGQYRLPSCSDEQIAVVNSAMLLSGPTMFYKTAVEMLSEWPTAAETHLTNSSLNQQAWIGQATCCFAFEASESQVKEAWRTLTKQQQKKANQVADEVIKLWRETYA